MTKTTALLIAASLVCTAAGAAEFTAERDGARVVLRVGAENARLVDGDSVAVEFRITDASSGQPLRGLRPAAWIDNRSLLAHPGGREASCRERIGAYSKGNVGSRPLIDLNGHYLLVLNRDPTISVIDPIVGIAGRTNLFTNIILPRPGADWAEHRTRRRLLVTMPRANQVAIIDSETFKVTALINTGPEPVRVVSQQGGPLAFTGNNGNGTVSVIDLATGKPLTTLAVGRGHHEMQLVESAARLFVTNRTDQSVSVIDTAALAVVQTTPLTGVPSALAYSPVADAVYAASGNDGRIVALAARTGAQTATTTLGGAVDALYSAPDGRTVIALSTEGRRATVLDAANLKVLHQITLPAAPFQLAFTGEFAHIRMYDTERVALLPLASLNQAAAPVLGGYAAGSGAPRRDSVAVLAPGLAATPDNMAAVVVNPADGRLHYYMEGMNAISGSFRNYGHPPQAVRVTERALQERAPGTYVAQVRLPAAGTISVALRLEQPRLTECFDFSVARNPSMDAAEQRLQVSLADLAPVLANAKARPVRLRIAAENGTPVALPETAVLRYFRAPGVDRGSVPLKVVAEGLYEAEVLFGQPGAYYLQIDSSALLTPPFISLQVRAE